MRGSRDRGSASVEFLALLVGVVVPLIHLLAGVAEVHAASFAVEAAAQRAARVATAGDPEDWRQSALRAVESSLGDRPARVIVTDDDEDGRLSRGEYLTVTITESVSVVPPLPGAVQVEARGVARLDPCRSLFGAGARIEAPTGMVSGRGGCED